MYGKVRVMQITLTNRLKQSEIYSLAVERYQITLGRRVDVYR